MYVIAVIIVNYPLAGNDWVAIAIVAFLISGFILALWCFIVVIFRAITLRRRCGLWFFMLMRPNIMTEVAQILEERPDFEEELFCSYWRDEEHAQMALKIIKLVHEVWELPNKMIYPNDSLMLLYEHLFLPDVDPEPDNYWERICDETNMNEDENNYNFLYDYDNSFAEFVEVCVRNNKNRES